jgi:hypothetical protein
LKKGKTHPAPVSLSIENKREKHDSQQIPQVRHCSQEGNEKGRKKKNEKKQNKQMK